MSNRTKLVASGVLFVFAGLLVYDAQAGNLASTASTEYFYVTLQANQYFKYTGAEEDVTLLIDDITFSGYTDPPCPGSLHCSFLETDWGAGAGDLGTPISYSTVNPPTSTSGPAPGGTAVMYTSSSSSSSGSTSFFTVGRSWINGLGLLDEGEPGAGFSPINIDVWSASGFAATAVRETHESAMFMEQWVSWRAGEGGGTNVGGAGGAGVGTGTGVGMAGWTVVTTQSRHYQTPYIVQGTRVVLASGIGQPVNGTALIKGRIITDPTEAPIVNTDFTVYSQ